MRCHVGTSSHRNRMSPLLVAFSHDPRAMPPNPIVAGRLLPGSAHLLLIELPRDADPARRLPRWIKRRAIGVTGYACRHRWRSSALAILLVPQSSLSRCDPHAACDRSLTPGAVVVARSCLVQPSPLKNLFPSASGRFYRWSRAWICLGWCRWIGRHYWTTELPLIVGSPRHIYNCFLVWSTPLYGFWILIVIVRFWILDSEYII